MKYAGLLNLILLPSLLSGHPGHGIGSGFEFSHFMGSAIHLITGIIILGFAIAIWNHKLKKHHFIQ